MSYYITGSGSLKINPENIPFVLAAGDEIRKCAHFRNLPEMFRWFYITYDQENNELSFDYVRLDIQDELLEAISPWVEDGSRIDMTGEDGGRWLWCWKGHKFYDCPGVVTYEGDPYEEKA